MEKNPTLAKIEKLLKERNWSVYKLAQESNLPYSSINNIFQRNTEPTIPTLRSICKGFNISLSEFFSDEPPVRETDYTCEEQQLLIEYREMKRTDRALLKTYAAGLLKKLPKADNGE